MDVRKTPKNASKVEPWKSNRSRRVSLPVCGAFFAGISLLNPSTLVAQEPQVDVAVPPNIGEGSSNAVDRSSSSVSQALRFLPQQRPIGQIDIDLSSKPRKGSETMPEDVARQFMDTSPAIRASRSDDMAGELGLTVHRNHDEQIVHQPLYFEEVNLERYGRTCGPLQPAISGVRFLATIPALPYAMSVHHPNRTYVTRWPYDAGWGAPKVQEYQPLKLKPSMVQAGAITGLLFVVP